MSALQSSGLQGSDIDLVIVATSSPDDMYIYNSIMKKYVLPISLFLLCRFGDATSVAHAVGYGHFDTGFTISCFSCGSCALYRASNAVAFDVTAACSGFMFGMVELGFGLILLA